MSSRVIGEDEIEKRLMEAGKRPAEIEELLSKYAAATTHDLPDATAIADILSRSEEEKVFRVRGFSLSPEDFDALTDYFQESGKLSSQGQVNGSRLVRLALEEFMTLIS